MAGSPDPVHTLLDAPLPAIEQREPGTVEEHRLWFVEYLVDVCLALDGVKDTARALLLSALAELDRRRG